jgi:UTP:GlnB (protein PII) uridylyltransferase
MKFPKNITRKEKKYLKEVYENALEKNKKKPIKKARSIAKAKFYEECFKIFLKKENEIIVNEIWEKQNPKKLFSYIEESIDYKKYNIGNNKFIVSTDKKILEKYSDSERKGMLRNINDEFEQEILFKIKNKYNIRLDPDMYYVIK